MPEIFRRAEGGNESREIPKKSAVTMPPCCSDPDRSQQLKSALLDIKDINSTDQTAAFLSSTNICQLFDTKLYLCRPSSSR